MIDSPAVVAVVPIPDVLRPIPARIATVAEGREAIVPCVTLNYRCTWRWKPLTEAGGRGTMPDIIGAAVGVGFLVLWIYCIYDVVTTDDAIIQHLPKVAWTLIVVLLSDLGSLLWLGLGRPRVWARRAHDPNYRASHQRPLYSGQSDGDLAGPNPIVEYREEQARLRFREEQLNRREEELRRRELGQG